MRLGQVYQHEAQAKKTALSPEARLRFHQEHSQKIMDELHQWMRQQLDQKRVEPNSGLGQAFNYMLRHWDPLTLFLRQAGAPLDNNLCERALKMAILHRKNSLGYKTQNGARLGDMFMSLIHTCRLCAANPLEPIRPGWVRSSGLRSTGIEGWQRLLVIPGCSPGSEG